LRINGHLTAVGHDELVITAHQAYGNCPQYIHQRYADEEALATGSSEGVRVSTALSPADRSLISAADTFFLGTTHPVRGSDASHKGGPAGFVHVTSETELSWQDFKGNNMFNSFGNLEVDDEAALLFIDFVSGTTVHLSGTARLRWDPSAGPGGVVSRQCDFSVAAVTVAKPAL
jgi:predicted pyridoxine 5'-phosphate oxidase superfamily flavin-nucleotide-binding protein